MPNGFWRSEKGVEEYRKIGLDYPNTVTDDNYALFLKRNANSPHSSRNRRELRQLIRELANDGNQYLLYDMYEVMYSPLGGEDEFYCPGQGIYPIPVARPKIEIGPDMVTTDIVTGEIKRIDIGYELSFTKENCEMLHKYANDKSQQGGTQYILRRVGGREYRILTYESLRDNLFEELEPNPVTQAQPIPKRK